MFYFSHVTLCVFLMTSCVGQLITSKPEDSTTDSVYGIENYLKTKEQNMLNGSLTVSTYMATTRTTTQDFSTFPYVESKCRNKMVRGAYESGLCGAESSSNYLKTSRPLYTCAARCGEVRKFPTDCACDEKCLKHKDCCKDVESICPEVYKNAQRWIENARKYATACTDGMWATVDCVGSGKYPSQIMNFLESIATQSMPHNNSTVSTISLALVLEPIYHYSMAEYSTGNLYLNIITFASCADEDTKLVFTPRRATLHCPSDFPQRSLLAAHDIFSVCLVQSWENVRSSLQRICHVKKILSCRCDENIMTDYLHNICLGTDHSDQTSYRIPFDNRATAEIAEVPTVRQCEITPVERSRETLRPGEYKVHVITNPLVTEESASMGNISRETSIKSLIYVMDLPARSLERQLHCPTWYSPLYQCHLVACAKPALLVTGSVHSPSYRGGRSCALLTLAVVTLEQSSLSVSSCVCFKVMLAISALDLWRVKRQPLSKGACSLYLDVLDEDMESTFLTPENLKPVTPDFTTSKLKQLQKNLSREFGVPFCPGESTRPMLSICFYTSRDHEPGVHSPVKCLQLFQDRKVSLGQANSRAATIYGPTALVYDHILLFTVFSICVTKL